MSILCHIKREEIEKIYDQGKEAVVELVEGLIAEFNSKIKELTDRIDYLETFSPIVWLNSIRVLFSLAVNLDLAMY